MTTKMTTKARKPLNNYMKVGLVAAILSLSVPFALTHLVLPTNPDYFGAIMSTNFTFSAVAVASAVLLSVGAVKRFIDNQH